MYYVGKLLEREIKKIYIKKKKEFGRQNFNDKLVITEAFIQQPATKTIKMRSVEEIEIRNSVK